MVGTFSKFSQDVEQLLKFCAGKIAERWVVLNGLPDEEACAPLDGFTAVGWVSARDVISGSNEG